MFELHILIHNHWSDVQLEPRATCRDLAQALHIMSRDIFSTF